MGTVVVRCAVTGLDFAVGIETDEHSFVTLPDLKLKARCPHCQTDHEWSPRQARLRSDPRVDGCGRSVSPSRSHPNVERNATTGDASLPQGK